MRGLVIFVFTILVVGCVLGAFFAYKSFKLRAEVKAWKGYHDAVVARLNGLQKDYAGLSVYAGDNERLLKETSAKQRKKMTILFGASITKNWDTGRAFLGKSLINRGIGSQSDMQLLARFSDDVLRLEPGQVVIKFCSGNFQPQADPETIWDEYEMMAVMAGRRGIRPILATVIPATREAEVYENFSIATEIKKFNERLRKFASENNFAVADYFAAMTDKDGFLPAEMAMDQIHPNEKGYEVMARILEPFLKE